jgi:hypothetical protein
MPQQPPAGGRSSSEPQGSAKNVGGEDGTRPAWYQVVVRGHVAPHRLRHYEAWTIRQEMGQETVLEGPIPDQAALYGLLSWLQGLGLSLVRVQPRERE